MHGQHTNFAESHSGFTPEDAFDQRIAQIHGIGESNDTRHAEMLAMIDSFLGAAYDAEKVARLLDLQDALHERQAELQIAYENGQLQPRNYVALFNTALREDFEACQTLLGQPDFEQLFGYSIDEAQGSLDPDAFISAEAARRQQGS